MRNRRQLLLPLLIFTLLAACAEADLQGIEGGSLTPDAGIGANDAGTGHGGANNDRGEPDSGGGSERDAGEAPPDSASGGDDVGQVADAAADTGEPPIDPCAADPSTPGWESLGVPGRAFTTPGEGRAPAIAIDASCRPVLAWHAGPRGSQYVHVARWDGTTWQPLGAPLHASAELSTTPTAVEIATWADEVFVAWIETFEGARKVHVRQWDGAQWLALDPSPSAELDGSRIALAVDGMGRPYVSWNYGDFSNGGYDTYVSRWETDHWRAMGQGVRHDPSTNWGALSPTLTFGASDEPIVAWQELNFIHLRRWNGTSWDLLGAGPLRGDPDNVSSFDPQLATDSAGRVVVGFREAGDSTDVFVRRWDGGGWQPLADHLQGTHWEGQRTNTLNLSLTIDPQDRPVVSWDEPMELPGTSGSTKGPTRVHVQRWSGSGFGPVGGGVLDTHVGVGSDGDSAAVATDPQGRVVVAWRERTDADSAYTIHVSRHTD